MFSVKNLTSIIKNPKSKYSFLIIVFEIFFIVEKEGNFCFSFQTNYL